MVHGVRQLLMFTLATLPGYPYEILLSSMLAMTKRNLALTLELFALHSTSYEKSHLLGEMFAASGEYRRERFTSKCSCDF